jgi:hypothetical protein
VTSTGQLYPNPNAAVAAGMSEELLFQFLGKILGKALYEGVVVQPQFARFFLAKLLNKPTYLHDHLPQLDMVRRGAVACRGRHQQLEVVAVALNDRRSCTRTSCS